MNTPENQADFRHLAADRDHQFVSTGFLCQLLQCLPRQLYVLMEDANIKFAQIVDGVGYLTIADAEAVADKCRDVRKEISDKLSTAENN